MVLRQLQRLDARAGVQVERPVAMVAVTLGFLTYVAVAFGTAVLFDGYAWLAMLFAAPLLLAATLRLLRPPPHSE